MNETTAGLPDKKYEIIYADPPWEYELTGSTTNARGLAKMHYGLMATKENCGLQIPSICSEKGAVCFLWATFPKVGAALEVMKAWGFEYKTAAFVWVKKYRSGGNAWGMGHYTRANAEVCLLGVTPGFKAGERVKSHKVHQIIEAPVEEHSKKPDEVRRRIVELLGDVPRIELFARQRADGWDAWGDELPDGDEQKEATGND